MSARPVVNCNFFRQVSLLHGQVRWRSKLLEQHTTRTHATARRSVVEAAGLRMPKSIKGTGARATHVRSSPSLSRFLACSRVLYLSGFLYLTLFFFSLSLSLVSGFVSLFLWMSRFVFLSLSNNLSGFLSFCRSLVAYA